MKNRIEISGKKRKRSISPSASVAEKNQSEGEQLKKKRIVIEKGSSTSPTFHLNMERPPSDQQKRSRKGNLSSLPLLEIEEVKRTKGANDDDDEIMFLKVTNFFLTSSSSSFSDHRRKNIQAALDYINLQVLRSTDTFQKDCVIFIACHRRMTTMHGTNTPCLSSYTSRNSEEVVSSSLQSSSSASSVLHPSKKSQQIRNRQHLEIVGVCIVKELTEAQRLHTETEEAVDVVSEDKESVHPCGRKHHDPSPSLTVGDIRAVGCICGVQLIWTSISVLRQGVATALVDVARQNLIYGNAYCIPRQQVAFSEPTKEGTLFARKYVGRNDFLVFW